MTIPGFTPALTRPTTATTTAATAESAPNGDQPGTDTTPAFADLLQALAIGGTPTPAATTPAATTPTATTAGLPGEIGARVDGEQTETDTTAALMSAMVVPTLGLPFAAAQPVTANTEQAKGTPDAVTAPTQPAPGDQAPAAAASHPAAAAVSTTDANGFVEVPAAGAPKSPARAVTEAVSPQQTAAGAQPTGADASTAELPAGAVTTPVVGGTGAEQVPTGGETGAGLESATGAADNPFVDNTTTLSADAPTTHSGTVRAEAQQTAPVDGVVVPTAQADGTAAATAIPTQPTASTAPAAEKPQSGTGDTATSATATASGQGTTQATSEKSTKDDSAKDDDKQAAPGVDAMARVEPTALSTQEFAVEVVRASTQDQGTVTAPAAAAPVTVPVATVDMARVQAVDTPAAPQAPHAPVHTQNAHQLAAELSPLRGHNGEHTLTVHLHPVDLGPVSLTARISGGDIHLDLGSATEAGREALRAALPELRRELEQAGFGSCQLSDGAYSGTDRGAGDQWSQRAQWDQWTASAARRETAATAKTSQTATTTSTGPAAPARTAGVLDLHA
ncbi:flagellar hook-length control protein FliK [Actinokineospora globicatena]|uniref:Flagellar hook-length control protein-like C-terminal domain-containing protein n=1 Tax=Actinokineospora globicatena TaxID=103729 RepID=A0A9W6QN94_9PSEU|nr:flagellar hook-length control protein FliK [Actinokineospora globicatena]GLW93146.1 hypothetical protein Aglo03_39620 [Actinokineospora globicatena]